MQTIPLVYLLRNQSIFDKLILTIGVIFISFSSVFVHIISAGPATIGVYRMAIGAVILLIVTLLRKERLFIVNRFTLSALLAGFFFCLDLVTWHQSILYVGPGLATILNSCQIFFLLLISFFLLKERVNKYQMIALAGILPGGLLLCLTDWLTLDPHYHWGVIIGLLSGLCYSGYIYALRYANSQDSINTESNIENNNKKPTNTLSILTTATVSATLFLTLIAIFTGESLALHPHANYAWVTLYALISQVIGWGLISYALPKINISVAAFILILQPTLSFIWDVLFFSRPTPWFQWLGVIIILGAVFLANYKKTSQLN
ncbi:DMT family transporter [Piscirickettsia salmonis]|uniref:DMT family transporter n=2 Tax=Piscirickettsia salmonis TaxID=1238 RepID=UPI000315EF94|nr:DMT family transporter [Piscirickettsia salmonis]PEQ17493.1 EamA/RhaT family transporter [Piscirickettsia salmonis]QGN76422.1 carboxylate/amino acid/amine transporter [Piscirickettsia salmonis]QGN80012.1 carboxylate/amino acid/amine transporter [Piscirickettsia salmonis]QGN85715.1 carboxylate/amino acid/amine transporter [Piscirickettsia salmonis]QGN89221.1 carboxylate/amino acid/amine transporter [Piscirickettsia salmonis]